MPEKTKGSRALSEKDDRGSWCPDCSFPEASYLLKSRGIKSGFLKILLRSGEGSARCRMIPESKTHRLFCSFKESGDFPERGIVFFVVFFCFVFI